MTQLTFCVCDKQHHVRSNLETEEFISSCTSWYQLITEGNLGGEPLGGNLEAGTIQQGSWRSAAYWLILHDLLSSFSYSSQASLFRDGTVHHGLVPPISFSNHENAPTQAHRPISERQSDTLSSSQIHPNLCQTDKN